MGTQTNRLDGGRIEKTKQPSKKMVRPSDSLSRKGKAMWRKGGGVKEKIPAGTRTMKRPVEHANFLPKEYAKINGRGGGACKSNGEVNGER